MRLSRGICFIITDLETADLMIITRAGSMRQIAIAAPDAFSLAQASHPSLNRNCITLSIEPADRLYITDQRSNSPRGRVELSLTTGKAISFISDRGRFDVRRYKLSELLGKVGR